MAFAGIVLMSVVAAVAYGVVHNQITARVCVEYFTVGHPQVFGTTDPTLLGLGWGVLATWWVGVMLGVPLAVAARAGPQPRRSVASFVRPILCLLAATAVCAVAAGVAGWVLAERGIVVLLRPLAAVVPSDRQVPFLADLWAHTMSYFAGFVGGLVVVWKVWRSRQ